MRLDRILVGAAVAATLSSAAMARDYISIAGSSLYCPLQLSLPKLWATTRTSKRPSSDQGAHLSVRKGLRRDRHRIY